MKKDKKIFEGAKPMKLFYLFLLILFLFYIRYFYLATAKTIDGINMKEFAMNRNTVSKILYANRGTIYDSSDNILAVNMSSYTVIAYLSSSRGNDYVKDKEATASLLAPILNMKEEDLIKLFNVNTDVGSPNYWYQTVIDIVNNWYNDEKNKKYTLGFNWLKKANCFYMSC